MHLGSRIKLLDEQCINQIAAGEVVERPLSVVKELIENSLDADAHKIEIIIEGGGTSLIKIKDDGVGISAEDLRLAVLPHATSKITTIEDLDTLQTLGFRGEALPSIASVSLLSIQSRTPDQVTGYEIQMEGGKLLSLAEVGCPFGTVVTVKDLFYNVPARQKFLRSAPTEFGWISDVVSRQALARPDVAFSLRHPNKLIFNTGGNGNFLETIAEVIGNDTARRMIAVSYADQNLTISGYISSADFVRSSRNGLTFLVNGRVIHSQLLNQALKEGYHTLIPSNVYPTCVLSINMLPSEYDVNVHPAKMEIKFKAEKELKQKVADVIRQTLLTGRPVRNITLSEKENTSFTPEKRDPNPVSENISANWEQLKILYKPLNQDFSAQEAPEKQYANVEHTELEKSRDNRMTDNILDIPVEQKQDETKLALFQELRSLGQLLNTYILATDEKSLYIIDQHAAHERIRYEKLLKLAQDHKAQSQMLLVPETVDLTVQEEQILLEHFTELHEMGFIFEHFGERTYFLRGVPLLNHMETPGTLFKMFIDERLSTSFPPTQAKLLEDWIFILACRSAIKGKERLSIQEMDELLQQLGNTVNPYSCPHGRPTLINISQKELERKFGRG